MDSEPWDDLTTSIAHTASRPKRVRVVYEETVEGWRASSPDVGSIAVARPTRADLDEAVRARLAAWLDPAIEVVFEG